MAVAFIPVRGGSKSIPLKNIKPFCGRPLIYWNLEALQQVDAVERVIVATDSDEIESVATGFGFSKVEVYRRSSESATDTASTEPVMLEYLQTHPENDAELFLLVQATSPLTRAEDFLHALELFSETMEESHRFDSLLSCVRTKRFFWNPDGTPLNYDYRRRPRRQEFDGLFMENGAFYINRVGNILKDKNRLSGNIGIHEMPEFTSVEIDEPDDWIVAEAVMRRNEPERLLREAVDIGLFMSDVDAEP